jgi:hypothetical protein
MDSLSAALLITPQYCLAMGAGVLEYFLRSYFLHSSTLSHGITAIGACLVVSGEIVRKSAMVRNCHVLLMPAQCLLHPGVHTDQNQ